MDRKNKTITVYLSEVERENLDKCVELKHLSKSEIIRLGLWKMFREYLPEPNDEERLNYIIDQRVKLILERGLT